MNDLPVSRAARGKLCTQGTTPREKLDHLRRKPSADRLSASENLCCIIKRQIRQRLKSSWELQEQEMVPVSRLQQSPQIPDQVSLSASDKSLCAIFSLIWGSHVSYITSVFLLWKRGAGGLQITELNGLWTEFQNKSSDPPDRAESETSSWNQSLWTSQKHRVGEVSLFRTRQIKRVWMKTFIV